MTVERAFAHRAGDLATLGGLEVPFLAQVTLRVGAEHADVLGLPVEPNTVMRVGDRSTLWLGPDEWLVTSDAHPAATIVAALEAALAGRHHAVIDVGANRAVLDLTGDGALDLLATGCSLDLHPIAWRNRRCAQTLFARAPVMLEQRESATRVYVRPSFADYLLDRLLAAMVAGP